MCIIHVVSGSTFLRAFFLSISISFTLERLRGSFENYSVETRFFGFEFFFLDSRDRNCSFLDRRRDDKTRMSLMSQKCKVTFASGLGCAFCGDDTRIENTHAKIADCRIRVFKMDGWLFRSFFYHIGF